ncbi:iron-sulfur cluster repair protein YtfE [Budvicia aquatica]|uniref:Iron-sulfur cluster repair protein YtfE n=1 Tax=Budvicia aquatica TaxID=82979 RepID=A0A2C6CQL3_9GAMM|nr:iron-sulfur cluster repair protein YtfE [Budvicia aquatica]MBP9643012.1 iron-sulfur cluster repair protein YtfE [Budvicia sp.]PHI28949.1 iron-sulfur cluster repair protein YtfE [Budvicia aquatica]VFS47076.1 Regulator of cell morphogenesis and NO signaling [Budvicia aquatica]
MDYPNQSLGALAIAIPGATKLFRQYDLDFCCGGKQTLERSAARKMLNIDVIVEQLEQLAAKPTNDKDWSTASNSEMIPYIIQRFHQRHREQLPELILLAEKVERVHAAKPTCPKGLAAQLNTIYQDLSQHMMKEEQILFPMIQQGMGAQASGPIRVMEMEHDRAGNDVEAIKSITNNLTAPQEACNTWRALYASVDEFITDLMEHIHLENNILFPRALRGE